MPAGINVTIFSLQPIKLGLASLGALLAWADRPAVASGQLPMTLLWHYAAMARYLHRAGGAGGV